MEKEFWHVLFLTGAFALGYFASSTLDNKDIAAFKIIMGAFNPPQCVTGLPVVFANYQKGVQ